jgi:hypothetical protein
VLLARMQAPRAHGNGLEVANSAAPAGRSALSFAESKGGGMTDRFVALFSAGLLALGLFAGMVGGAGLAIADDQAAARVPDPHREGRQDRPG